jgi:hypothetical protein
MPKKEKGDQVYPFIKKLAANGKGDLEEDEKLGC